MNSEHVLQISIHFRKLLFLFLLFSPFCLLVPLLNIEFLFIQNYISFKSLLIEKKTYLHVHKCLYLKWNISEVFVHIYMHHVFCMGCSLNKNNTMKLYTYHLIFANSDNITKNTYNWQLNFITVRYTDIVLFKTIYGWRMLMSIFHWIADEGHLSWFKTIVYCRIYK